MTAIKKTLGSIFYCWHDKMLYLGPLPPSKPHGLLVPAICVGMNKKLNATLSDEKTILHFRSVIWPINYHHQTDTLDDMAGVLLLDPSALHFRTIIKNLSTNSHGCYDDLFFEKNIIKVFDHLYQEQPDAKSAARLLDNLFEESASTISNAPATIDKRIENVLVLLKREPSQKHNLQKLAKIAGLSEVYLMQLFKKEIGMPIGKYQLWLKLCLASRNALKGSTLTHAAINAGFADAAHYSRAFTSVMGVNPSIFYDDKHGVRTAIFDEWPH